MARRAVLHFFGEATVAEGQHELEQGYQDVQADPGQEVALLGGIGALLPAGAAEVADGGRVFLVLGYGGGGGQDAEVGNALALGDEGESAPVGGEAFFS